MSVAAKSIRSPLDERTVRMLKCGDSVLITGELLTARDAAHRLMAERISKGLALPVDLAGRILFYAGPSPKPPGRVAGAIGPTTSGRMDPFTIPLLEAGLKGMIGKGRRSEEVRRSMVEHGAVYFAAIGGTAVLLSGCITSMEPAAFEEMGPEAIYRLQVVDFPVIVVNDVQGGDLYLRRDGAVSRPDCGGSRQESADPCRI
ncbi:fumarate hydratase C-terminal domain-containing protein [bacterium]|nr:fumarate hydratase C-terminal domain-containing protein [bacterium]